MYYYPNPAHKTETTEAGLTMASRQGALPENDAA